jgi:hypothetical protein
MFAIRMIFGEVADLKSWLPHKEDLKFGHGFPGRETSI